MSPLPAVSDRARAAIGSALSLLLVLGLGSGCKHSRPPQRPPPAAPWQVLDPASPQAAPVSPHAPSTVVVLGPVKHQRLLWSEGLTLSRAILQAEYYDRHDPRVILVIRQGERHLVPTAELLRGEIDPMIDPGDVIELQP